MYFVKYLSLLSQYAKDFKINKLAYGYSDSRGKSLENYYEAYIYSVVMFLNFCHKITNSPLKCHNPVYF